MAKKETYDAGSISVLEGLEAVRKRPGMYIGSVSRKGLNHLIYEIVDNAVDEHLAGYCSHIHVILEKDGSCTVADNGRGIPVDMHEKGVSAERLVFTTLHAGGSSHIAFQSVIKRPAFIFLAVNLNLFQAFILVQRNTAMKKKVVVINFVKAALVQQ